MEVQCGLRYGVARRAQRCKTGRVAYLFRLSVAPPETVAPARGLIRASPTHLGPIRAPFRSLVSCGDLRDRPRCFTPPRTCCRPLGVIWVSVPTVRLPGSSSVVSPSLVRLKCPVASGTYIRVRRKKTLSTVVFTELHFFHILSYGLHAVPVQCKSPKSSHRQLVLLQSLTWISVISSPLKTSYVN